MNNRSQICLLQIKRNRLAFAQILELNVRWVARAVVLSALTIGLLLSVAKARVQNSTPSSKQSEPSVRVAENGKRLYIKYGCYECHGIEGQGGGSAGPRIGPDPLPLAALIAYVREPTREMPPYTDKVVTDKELREIYEFLKSLPHPPPVSSERLLH